MESIQDILNSFQELANSELDQLPLIDAEDFDRDDIFSQKKGKLPGLIYLGCFALWLYRHEGLNIEKTREIKDISSKDIAYPAVFSEKTLEGKLFASMLRITYQDFAKDYITHKGLFAEDYQNLVVGELGLADMSEVPDDSKNFDKIWERISWRFNNYQLKNANWDEREPRPEIQLTAEERTIQGWKSSFIHTCHQLRESTLPHKEREIAVSHFWQLVDFVQGNSERELPVILLRSFTKNADSSLQEAVLRTLYSMPFENVWTAILADAERLENEGWLGGVLSLWGNTYSDEQLEYIEEKYDDISIKTRHLLQKEATKADYAQEPWAVKLQQI